jgi:parvulin-like peptidyl-prolyl isomerase
MLETLRRSQRWLMWIVIVGVGLVFVVFVGSGAPTGGSSEDVVVRVDARKFGVRDVDRIRRQQEQEYRRLLGDDFDRSAAAEHLDSLAANILANQAILAHDAERLGLVVSDQEVRDYVRRNIEWATDEGGRLRADVLRDYVEGEFGTENHFVELVRMDVLANKLQSLLRESVAVGEREARDSLLHRQEEVSIAYVALDASQPRGEIEDEVVETFLAGDEARVRQLYDERSGRYQRPEAVHVRHILFQAGENASEEEVEQAREQAQQALERLRGGADFAELASEVSDDPGTREQGGDLGFVERGGPLAASLEEAAFSLEPGTLSEPIRSGAGFHVLRVEEKRPARTVPFEEVRRELAQEILKSERAEREARETAERIAEAIRGGSSLVDAAREEALTLERPDPLRRRADGYVPGLGVAPEVLTAAFALDEAEASSARIFEAGEKRVLIQLLERRVPDDEEIQAQLADERERLQQSRTAEFSRVWLTERRNQLADSGKLAYDLSQLRP